MIIQRRNFLGATAAALGMAIAPKMAFANASTDTRFIFIIQRGAADGLNTLIPYADPQYSNLRGALAIDAKEAQKLDGMFALHPSLKNIGALYQSKNASFVHAIASPYRERSHFDGQNILESGGMRAYEIDNGWLNRLVGLLPKSPEAPIAFSPTIPLGLRGANPVTSFAPSQLPDANHDFLSRVSNLYEKDPQLYGLFNMANATNETAMGASGNGAAATGSLAATFLSRANGPRIAMIETNGWDTHFAQEARLARSLKDLDDLVGALKTGMGNEWKNTIILVATEFGRTAAANGTGGTDHGTGACAMVLGGKVKTSKILADWPGLRGADLYENRDLKPTNDLNGLIAGVAANAFNLDPQLVARQLFPNKAPNGLILGLV